MLHVSGLLIFIDEMDSITVTFSTAGGHSGCLWVLTAVGDFAVSVAIRVFCCWVYIWE
jgi:hypothetical protein